MRQNKHHKLLFINTLEILDETFETNETVFCGFSSLALFFHIFKPLFAVSFCLKCVSFCLILSHSVSFLKTEIKPLIDSYCNFYYLFYTNPVNGNNNLNPSQINSPPAISKIIPAFIIFVIGTIPEP